CGAGAGRLSICAYGGEGCDRRCEDGDDDGDERDLAHSLPPWCVCVLLCAGRDASPGACATATVVTHGVSPPSHFSLCLPGSCSGVCRRTSCGGSSRSPAGGALRAARSSSTSATRPTRCT